MKKKILIAVLLVTLPIALLPGCGQHPQPSPSPTVASGLSPSPSEETSSSVVQSGLPLKVTEPADAATLTSNSIIVKGQTVPGSTVSVNEEAAVADDNGNFSVNISLDNGLNAIDVIATDDKGKEGEVLLMVNVVSSESPASTANQGVTSNVSPNAIPLTVTQPADGADISASTVTVKGQTKPGATVSINDQADVADNNGNFNIPVSLINGHNAIDVVAIDDSGNEAEVILIVNAVTGG